MSKKHTYNQMDRRNLKNMLMNYYENIALNVYKYNSMPKEIPIRYPERWLYTSGCCAFLIYEDADLGELPMILPVSTQSIAKNVYGEPSSWRVTGVGDLGQKVSALVLDNENSVFMRNDFTYTPSVPYVDHLVEQLVNIELTARLNTNAQKSPMWIKSNDANVLQNKNLYRMMYECEPQIFIDSMDSNIEFFNTGIPFIANDICDLYNTYHYRIMSYLGCNNPTVDKKERVLQSEFESNNDTVELIQEQRFAQRELNCEQINDVFGIGVSVEKNNFNNMEDVEDKQESEQKSEEVDK